MLVDVRTPDEYRTGHKEGALNIPADEVEQRAPQLLPDTDMPRLFELFKQRGDQCKFVYDDDMAAMVNTIHA